MNAVDIIAHKRDGHTLSADEIDYFVQGFAQDDIPDYQVSAWAMAVLLRGMTAQETIDLTRSMVNSGETLDLSGLEACVVDKHSTGGVGDKTTLVVAPLIAAAGLPVAKMSGRGLGFTGGTLDKLESIPGLSTSISTERFFELACAPGIVVAGQTADLVPADGKLYALRDVTATVPSLPLIASSIMSKKIAGGAQAIVLDVKVGSGAFMETLDKARELAELMIRIGEGVGRDVTAILSDMSQPLGNAVGNALEVIEAIETLRGGGPKDFREHCLAVAVEMLLLGCLVENPHDAVALAHDILESGRAMQKFVQWIEAQGGDVAAIKDTRLLPRAPVMETLEATRMGYVAGIDAREVGLTAVGLGAGREIKGEAIDPAVGILLKTKVGDRVDKDQPVLEVHARTASAARTALERLRRAYTWSVESVKPPPLVFDTLRGIPNPRDR